jgi:arylsulfatase A-like enzyme
MAYRSVHHARELLACMLAVLAPLISQAADTTTRPNVVLIITDDQGWGDFSFHGNPRLKTPHIDRLADESVELTQFYVSPVCAPTRASLLTGRYNYRTGAIDTYLGRATMAPDEMTLAEMLSAAGYRTGIFGKWHLGDNYPCRPTDQGFQEALVHRGGGIGQPADPPENHYLNPMLLHNDRDEKAQGYCSDVFTSAAVQFIHQREADPFFVYLAFNCPHNPLEVPPGYENRYSGTDLGEGTAKVYAMIANIDDNVGRLLAALDELKRSDNTIVVFLTDNGPAHRGYNGVLRDRKGSVHDGGIRTPCLLRWPGKFRPGTKNSQLAAHIDLVPTLLAACNVQIPPAVTLDGLNLLDVLTGKTQSLDDRKLFFQWHRGDQPDRYRACAVRFDRFKLVQPDARPVAAGATLPWELFDMIADPGERENVVDKHPKVVAAMKGAYDSWFDDVAATRGFPTPKIIAGTTHENPLTLTRQDWRGAQAGWEKGSLGHWQVELAAEAPYDISLRITPGKAPRQTVLRVGNAELNAVLPAGADRVTYSQVALNRGQTRIEGAVQTDGTWQGVEYVDLDCKQPVANP